MEPLVYYFIILGLLLKSSAAVGYSVLLFVPKKPLLFGCTQCNEVVDTPFPINAVFTSSAAFSEVFFTLILVGFKGRNNAPNIAQFNSMPISHTSFFHTNTDVIIFMYLFILYITITYNYILQFLYINILMNINIYVYTYVLYICRYKNLFINIYVSLSYHNILYRN